LKVSKFLDTARRFAHAWHANLKKARVDKLEILCALFSWSIAVRGANSCIRAWQIAAREPLMTRTNDQGRENGQVEAERTGMEAARKKIKAGKGECVER